MWTCVDAHLLLHALSLSLSLSFFPLRHRVAEPPKLYAFGEGVGSHPGTFLVAGNTVTPKGPPSIPGHFFAGTCALDGTRSGPAVESFGNGTVFHGNYDADKRSGAGSITFADGSQYTGAFQDGVFHGQGTLRTGQSVFEGTWANGYLNGHATVREASGLVCEGEFSHGRRNGFCKVTYPSGAVYEGNWVNDKKQGEGTQTWPSGLTYKGSWKDGKQHGPGVMRLPSGRTMQGTWEHGQPSAASAHHVRPATTH